MTRKRSAELQKLPRMRLKAPRKDAPTVVTFRPTTEPTPLSVKVQIVRAGVEHRTPLSLRGAQGGSYGFTGSFPSGRPKTLLRLL